jgi:hypothetical protein
VCDECAVASVSGWWVVMKEGEGRKEDGVWEGGVVVMEMDGDGGGRRGTVIPEVERMVVTAGTTPTRLCMPQPNPTFLPLTGRHPSYAWHACAATQEWRSSFDSARTWRTAGILITE